MEADLQRFYAVDYRDRWRGDLTLRRLWVLIRHLPPESAVAALRRDGKPHWGPEAHLLDGVRMAVESLRNTMAGKNRTVKPHPMRPRPTAKPRHHTPQRRRQLAAARRRAQARRRAIGAGEIT